jgi:hypothetical protein
MAYAQDRSPRRWRSNRSGHLRVSRFVALAALIKTFWKRYEGIGFAILFAIFAPLLTYLLWVVVLIL